MSGKLRRDCVIGVVVLAGALFLFWYSFSLPKSSAIYPQMILSVIVLLDLLLLAGVVRAALDVRAGRAEPAAEEKQPAAPYLVFVAVMAYVALFQFAGYYLATIAMMVGLMVFFKVRSWKALLGVPLGYLLFVYLLFELQFRLPL